jgi:hypothetical protein
MEMEFETSEVERPSFPLDREIAAAGLYATADRFLDLVDFVAKHWRIAAYNALLLHVQKPDLTHVETVTSWWAHYRRKPRRKARPLITLQPFSPVSLVYDLHDTQGGDVPDHDLGSYPDLEFHHEDILMQRLEDLSRKGIDVHFSPTASASCSIRPAAAPKEQRRSRHYMITVPENDFTRGFRALVYQLAGVYLGHHGLDEDRGIKHGSYSETLKPYEAAYLTHMVCERCGVREGRRRDPPIYDGSYEDFDVYRLMKATGDVERLLQLPLIPIGRSRFDA